MLSPGPSLGIVEPYPPHRAGHKSCEGIALPGRLRHSLGGMVCRGGSLRMFVFKATDNPARARGKPPPARRVRRGRRRLTLSI